MAFRPLTQKQTHDVMAKEIIKVFHEFGIDVEKVTHIVTDGGSAFGKAFKVYGRGSDPLVGKPVSENDFDEENDENTSAFIQSDDGEVYTNNVIQYDTDAGNGMPMESIDDINDDSTEDLNEIKNTLSTGGESDDLFNAIRNNENESEPVKLPKQRRCLSHLLNLLATDFVNSFCIRPKKAYVTTFSKLQAI